MQINELDKEYLKIVKDIIGNKEFDRLKDCEHHGITRYDHSLKVSYQAYKYAKKHGLNYEEVARGGLLHDFFITERMNTKEKLISTFNHPEKAQINARSTFNITERESDIIVSHMFPLGRNIPKYSESWLVSMFDKKVAISEFLSKFNYRFRYAGNLSVLVLLNFIK